MTLADPLRAPHPSGAARHIVGAGLAALFLFRAPSATAEPEPSPEPTAEPAPAADDRAPLTGIALDAGVMSALPALLTYGQTLGGELGISDGFGPLALAFTTSIASATEDTLSWHETFLEIRLRARIGVRARAGRALLSLRFGAGATLVHADRTAHPIGARGADGDGLAPSEWSAIPAFELDAGITVRLVGDWGLALFIGPSLHVGAVADADNVWGWRGTLGLVWAP